MSPTFLSIFPFNLVLLNLDILNPLWLVVMIMQQNDDIAYNNGTCATLSTGAYVTFHCGQFHLLFVTFTNWYIAPVLH